MVGFPYANHQITTVVVVVIGEGYVHLAICHSDRTSIYQAHRIPGLQITSRFTSECGIVYFFQIDFENGVTKIGSAISIVRIEGE